MCKCHTVEHEDKGICFYSLANSRTFCSIRKVTSTVQPSSPCPGPQVPTAGNEVGPSRYWPWGASRVQEATAEQVRMSCTSGSQLRNETPQVRTVVRKSIPYPQLPAVCFSLADQRLGGDGDGDRGGEGIALVLLPLPPFTVALSYEALLQERKSYLASIVNGALVEKLPGGQRTGRLQAWMQAWPPSPIILR